MISYITFIAKIFTRQAGLNVLIQIIVQNNGMSYIWATQDFKVDSNMYINVNVTSLNNSVTAGLHVMLWIVII